MTADNLYNRDILRLAVSLPPGDRLENPDATAERRASTCGSRIAADVKLGHDGRITDIAIRAAACALGQASAAILRLHAAGHDSGDVAAIRGALAAALQNKGAPPAIWPQLALLAVARDVPARHAAILLPYDAILAAMELAAPRPAAG